MNQQIRISSFVLSLVCMSAGCGSDPVGELTRLLQDEDVSVRRAAVRDLGAMGLKAISAAPALAKAVDDNDREVRRLACFALGQLGDRAESCLPALLEALDDEEFSVRLASAFAIERISPDEPTHFAVLTKAMQMGEGGVIVAVGERGVRSAWAVPTLISLLKDKRPGIRRISADALLQVGPAASAAEDALRQCLENDTDDRVREAAERALNALQ